VAAIAMYSAGLVAASYSLNSLCFWLSPVALVVISAVPAKA